MTSTPPVVPAYNKPEQPGIWMNFDNTVSIYHVVQPEDSFDTAAAALFDALRDAQARFPNWPRVLYLDITGHIDAMGRFEPDMLELQQEFLVAALGTYFTALDMPLISLLNPDPQSNDVPDSLAIRNPAEDDG